MSKIEEVARAIYEAYENRPPYAQLQMNGHLALDLALAAIRALREPTGEMEIAGNDALVLNGLGDVEGDDSTRAWQAMIDHLLSEVEAKT